MLIQNAVLLKPVINLLFSEQESTMQPRNLVAAVVTGKGCQGDHRGGDNVHEMNYLGKIREAI